jgi:hypothetical protein
LRTQQQGRAVANTPHRQPDVTGPSAEHLQAGFHGRGALMEECEQQHGSDSTQFPPGGEQIASMESAIS